MKTYNVIVHVGFAESAMIPALIFEHNIGFESPRKAVLNLHECLNMALSRCIEYGTWEKQAPIYEEGEEEDEYCIRSFLEELSRSTNDGSPAGYEAWEELCSLGWNYSGELIEGVHVTIFDQGEKILASRTSINNQFDAFEGKYLPHSESNDWPLSPSLRLAEVTIKHIPPVEVIKKEGRNDE